MSSIGQDVRYAYRMLAKRPAFTAVVVFTLALGIGATAVVFSVLNAVVLRPLDLNEPDRVVTIWESSSKPGLEQTWAAYPNFEDWREQNDVFESIAALRSQGSILTGVDEPERIRGALVTADFFPLLRVRAALGRLLVAEDEQPGSQEVVLLSDGLWRRRFGADPEIIGREITLNGIAHTVVGVLPPDFDFPSGISGAEVWRPVTFIKPPIFLTSRGAHTFSVIGRLKPRVTHELAQTSMDTIASRLQQQYPDTNAEWGVKLVPLHDHVVGEIRPILLLLLGAVALVLLIACMNVSNMLLARSEDRKREFAVRGALGAGRFRQVRQLLTESALLGMAGCGLALLLAFWGKDVLTTLLPADLPRADEISIDGRVVTFAVGLSLASCLLFGLVPALRTTPSKLTVALTAGRQTRSSWTCGSRLRSALIVSEVALALLLLVGAGLLTRSLSRLLSEDLGFDPENILTFELSLPRPTEMGPEQQDSIYRQIRERLESLPAVRSVSTNTALPLTGRIGLKFSIPERPEPVSGEELVALYGAISPGYFDTMRIPLLRGRSFNEFDVRGQPGVVIINEAMASRYWPDEDPLGKSMKMNGSVWWDESELCEIVGIVGNTRESILDEPEPYMYVPVAQQVWHFATFALRTEGDSTELVDAVRREVAAVTRETAPHAFLTLEQHLSAAIAPRKFTMITLGLYAVVALLLASIGLYGVMSHSVSQRTHEIGVRMAVGAGRGDVMRLVLWRGAGLTAIGMGIGLTVSLAASRALSSQLYEIETTDPTAFAGVSALLGSVAMLACYVPARRATKVDPMVALRCE